LDCLLHFLQLPDLTLGATARQHQLFINWQQQKAYTSAFASWVKAWMRLMQQDGAGGLIEMLAMGCPSTAELFMHWSAENLMSALETLWLFMGINRGIIAAVSRRKELPLPSTMEQKLWLGSTRRLFEQGRHKSTVLGLQLVQLQWLSRAIAAAGGVLLQQRDRRGGSGAVPQQCFFGSRHG
jgi:hypothetical protein